MHTFFFNVFVSLGTHDSLQVAAYNEQGMSPISVRSNFLVLRLRSQAQAQAEQQKVCGNITIRLYVDERVFPMLLLNQSVVMFPCVDLLEQHDNIQFLLLPQDASVPSWQTVSQHGGGLVIAYCDLPAPSASSSSSSPASSSSSAAAAALMNVAQRLRLPNAVAVAYTSGHPVRASVLS